MLVGWVLEALEWVGVNSEKTDSLILSIRHIKCKFNEFVLSLLVLSSSGPGVKPPKSGL